MNDNQNSQIADFANVAIRLLQGVVYDENRPVWNELLTYQGPILNYFAQIGLTLVLNEKDGFAYLMQAEEYGGNINLPRLMRKYSLSYELTMLLVILRDFMEEHDSKPTDTKKCFISENEIKERISLFFKDKANKTKLLSKIEANINKAVYYKFLRLLPKNENLEENRYEVMRIIKSKISLSKLEEIKANQQELLK